MRPINQRRFELGASEQLVREMRLHDDEDFFSFTRLSIKTFNDLLALVGPSLLKQASRNDVLTPYMRLLITLRYCFSLPKVFFIYIKFVDTWKLVSHLCLFI